VSLYLRTFKEESVLEVWESESGPFHLAATHAILAWSGELGPKLAEGDRQAPEGFYELTADSLNPSSKFHRSLDLGFPNAYDRHHQRSGSHLMIHGGQQSVGCYSIGDAAIGEVYELVDEETKDGGNVPFHCFPFRMTEVNLQLHVSHQWSDFWMQELAPAALWFEETRRVPTVTASGGRYQLA